MQIICFEDEGVERLRPIIHARPAYGITCASFRLVDWLRQMPGTLAGAVRDYLQVIQQLDYQLMPPTPPSDRDGVLLVNARLVPRVESVETLRRLAGENRSAAVIDPGDHAVLAARLTAADLDQLDTRHPSGRPMPLVEALLSLAQHQPAAEASLEAFHWPHEVIWWHMREMPAAMQWRIDHGEYRQLQDGVFVGEGVRIGQYASIDTDDGPILFENDVKVSPFCFLEGPVYAGAGTRITEHAALKDGVSLGHTVKIGGEVEASVIEPYTNKQHHGFLGHSYLGSWINLGAGTCNSDLKNTYGKINIECGDQKIASGMQFLGCIMGDYSKTAINTGIFTGKVIGVCSMLYGFVTANVPSYVNYAKLFGQTSLLPAEVMINTQQRMFARRDVEQRDCDRQLILDMYTRTENEREASEQLAL